MLDDRWLYSILWDQLHLDCLFKKLRHWCMLDGPPVASVKRTFHVEILNLLRFPERKKE